MLFLVILSYNVIGATIQGTVYNFNLEKMSDVVVVVNTEPQQTFVVKNGSYSFNVPEGSYVIAAVYKVDSSLKTQENISIKSEGIYNLDLILFPTLQDEETLFDGVNLNLDEQYFNTVNFLPWIVGGIVVVVILLSLILIIIIRNGRSKNQKTVGVITEKDELTHLLNFIKKQGGRTTQKDIRKEFPSSEAKISLMIAELEKKGKVEKIKKGRGNIIILKG